jgi:hypothetical protein
MPHTPTTTPRSPGSTARPDPVDIATVRALWCALHPDAPVRTIVDDLVAGACGHPDVLQEAMRRLQSGRLERSTWVVAPALAVLETALAEAAAEPATRGGSHAPVEIRPARRHAHQPTEVATPSGRPLGRPADAR